MDGFQDIIIRNNWENLTFFVGNQNEENELHFEKHKKLRFLFPNGTKKTLPITWTKVVTPYGDMGRTYYAASMVPSITIKTLGMELTVDFVMLKKNNVKINYT